MNSISIDELFAATLQGGCDDQEPWDAVRALRKIATREVFTRAATFCESKDALVRARGADILAQIGKTAEHPTNAFADEAYSVVSTLIRCETEIMPLHSAISALGHLDNPSAVSLIAPFNTHNSAEIRFAVACALGSYPNEAESVEALLVLMKDVDDDVRDWATFSLGVLGDQDSERIRTALLERLRDSNEDAREEAMVALAKRKDARVLRLLKAALEMPKLKVRVAEAASLLLGMDIAPQDWGAEQYRKALKELYSY